MSDMTASKHQFLIQRLIECINSIGFFAMHYSGRHRIRSLDQNTSVNINDNYYIIAIIKHR